MTALDPDITRQLAEDLPPEVFGTVLRTFEADLARLAAQMRGAVAEGDLEAYHRGAHGLAGAAGAIGARHLESLARQAMKPASPASPAELLPQIDAAAGAAVAELAALVAQPPA